MLAAVMQVHKRCQSPGLKICSAGHNFGCPERACRCSAGLTSSCGNMAALVFSRSRHCRPQLATFGFKEEGVLLQHLVFLGIAPIPL